jgi:prolyl 3-hydroxylase /prolyl 3,4-dihydroxylase
MTKAKANDVNISALKKWIQPEYLTESKIYDLRVQFTKAKPYPHLELQHFFLEEPLTQVLKALSKEKFAFKQSDLFQFHQTQDLIGTKQKKIAEFRDFLYSDFVAYMQAITGMTFTNQVDLAGTLYQDTDFLLVHDDQLDGRKIAFLVYLSSMLADQGGSLNLFDTTPDKKTKKLLPNTVVKKITPQFGTLAFFEVNEISFHEVEEVYDTVDRVAIGGWYHE